jgi:hypothetical protein
MQTNKWNGVNPYIISKSLLWKKRIRIHDQIEYRASVSRRANDGLLEDVQHHHLDYWHGVQPSKLG